MARAKTDSGLSAKAETRAVQLLCEGHDAGSVAETIGADFSLVYLLANSGPVIELVERARQARLEQAARDAAKQAEEWAEQDRQEKAAATALQSAVIMLIPRQAEAIKRMGGKGGDVRMAVAEVDQLSSAFLKAQKGRRIASGRPVEKTQLDTNESAVVNKLEQLRQTVLGKDEPGREDGCAPGVPPAQPTVADPS